MHFVGRKAWGDWEATKITRETCRHLPTPSAAVAVAEGFSVVLALATAPCGRVAVGRGWAPRPRLPLRILRPGQLAVQAVLARETPRF